jgi:hypothetical protein
VISKFVRGTIPGDAGSGDPDVECNPDGNPFLSKHIDYTFTVRTEITYDL